MNTSDIITRLQIDPGALTLGQLLQDREASLHEIVRLRTDLDAVRLTPDRSIPAHQVAETAERAGLISDSLINIREVCAIIGLSRSSIYKRIPEGGFPAPLRVGLRSVRWRLSDIEAWRDSLS